ncbi:fimbria/pilus outer membrane usher protein [Lysobacter sp. F6437]|uniref:fimbria/pilus outer membrane usher protein n=1 Tax=Lysobacter sp. F6437 TaxID=3459296 RepID=UPI00403D7D13
MAKPPVCPYRASRNRLARGIALVLLALPLHAVAATAAGAGPAGESANPGFHTLDDLDLPAFGGVSFQAGSDTAAPADQRLYLDVYFGERATGQLVEFRLRDGVLHATPQALKEIGVLADPALAGDDGLLPLEALPGLVYDYQQASQRLVLDVPTNLRPLQELGYQRPQAVTATRDTGLLLNYDSYARHTDGTDTLSVSAMARWFGPLGALESSGVQHFGDGERGFRRLDTRWSYSDSESLSTWTAGDLVSGGLSWTRPVRLGGVQWRRNFSVRPDLITFPMPTFAGQATVPSSVELLVDNVSQFSSEVDDGPFVLDTFPRISGSGEATLVVRDALGRVTETSVPLYVDYQRLAPGLSDFSIEAGYLRTGFATDEDDYGDELVANASYRRGLSDSFTIEAHGEFGGDLRLGGIGAVWSPGARYGVFNLAAAHSHGLGMTGSLRSVGYQWMNRRFGLDLQAQRYGRGYRDLGELAIESAGSDGRDRMRAQDRASLWMAVPRGSIGYSWVRSDRFGDGGDRIQSLTWSSSWGQSLYSYLSAFDSEQGGLGISLSLNLSLGRQRDASLSVNHADGRNDVVAGLRQSLPYEGGWGWNLQAGRRNEQGIGQASASVRGSGGEATVGADRINGRTGYFGQASGSVVLMGGGMFTSRRVNDSFAVVSTNGVAGVPVLYENRELGITDEDGLLLLSDLRGWQRNRIAIDPDGLGAGYRLPPLETFATPADHGATLVRFEVERINPAMVTLLDAAGAPVAAGTEGRLPGGGGTFIVGLDGEAWLEDHDAGAVLVVDTGATTCRYRLPTTTTTAGLGAPARLGPLACGEGQ